MNALGPQNPEQSLLSAQADNAKSLIFVLSIMAFLGTLALLFSLSADRLRKNWQGELGSSATVQIMIESKELRQTQIEAALSVLRPALPNSAVDQLGEDKSKNLLKPWLGNLDLPDDLLLPVLISIKSSGDDIISPERLTAV